MSGSSDAQVPRTQASQAQSSLVQLHERAGSRADDSLQLRGVGVEAGFGPDKVVGEVHLLLDGPLGAEALADLLFGPTAGDESLPLAGGRTSHADDAVELRRGACFVEQRDDHDAAGSLLGLPEGDVGLPQFANAWMDNRFEGLAARIVGEDEPGERLAIKAAIGADDAGAKRGLDFAQRRLAGIDDLARQRVGVHDRDKPLLQQLPGGAFAHADAAGKTNHLHASCPHCSGAGAWGTKKIGCAQEPGASGSTDIWNWFIDRSWRLWLAWASMTVSVSFYSYFKDLTGATQTSESLPEGSTLGALHDRLAERFPKLAAMRKSTLLAVGIEYQSRDYVLRDGDTVSLFPPVQGG